MLCVITEKCLVYKKIIIIIIKTKPKKIEKFMGCPPSPFWLMRVANHPILVIGEPHPRSLEVVWPPLNRP
jgi:hypothetical protein